MNQREVIEREYVTSATFASAYKDVIEVIDRAVNYIDTNPEKAKETLSILREGFDTLRRHREHEARDRQSLLELDDELNRELDG